MTQVCKEMFLEGGASILKENHVCTVTVSFATQCTISALPHNLGMRSSLNVLLS
jgi:hypothetical protein